ncbi:MAG: S8 family serine peptidase [Jatrophihabitantaceae bacterium]
MRRRSLIAVAAGLAVAILLPALPASGAPGPADAPEYWFDTWHVGQLWNQGARGQGIVIAEIDTGVNANLAGLQGRILPGKDFGPEGGDGRVDREIKQFGHGTAMASLMVSRPSTLGITGLAPGAQVLPIAVPLSGTTDAGADDHLAAAITWAADHGAKVISMSLGGTRTASTDSTSCPSDEQAAIFHAMSKGAILLASGGNRGYSDNAVEEPAVCLGVVAVGAVDQSGVVAGFSSRHPYLTLDAPGVNIASLSRIPGEAYSGDGTSQATAIASAVMALVWSKYPNLTGSQVVARVLATLANRTAKATPAYGYGTLDAYTAVTAGVPADAANPIAAAAAPFAARTRVFADAPTPTAPPPAASSVKATGSFGIDGVPRLLGPSVVAGIGVAILGLLALLTLIVTGQVRRRRWRAPAPVRAAAGSLAVHVDVNGMLWHDIQSPTAPE